MPSWPHMSRTPPRLLMALALVAAAALIQLSVLIAIVSLPGDAVIASTTLGLMGRIQIGTHLLDLGALLLIPAAVFLARLVEYSAASPAQPATRTVLLGASAVGSASIFLIVLRLLADVAGEDLLAQTLPTTFVYDLSLLLVAAAGAAWAYWELQRTPPVPAEHPPAPMPDPNPSRPRPTSGFPSGPPVGPPPPEQPPPHR